MLPDRVSNPGPLTYGSGALPIALRGPAGLQCGNTVRCTLGRRDRSYNKLCIAKKSTYMYFIDLIFCVTGSFLGNQEPRR